MKSRVAALLGAWLIAIAAMASPDPPPNPTIARETAESNAKTPAGRRYQSALASSLDAWLARAIEKCGKGASPEDAVSFDVLVQIGDNGRAEDVLVAPETSVGRCARRDFQDARYPSPPEGHWWVKIPIQLK